MIRRSHYVLNSASELCGPTCGAGRRAGLFVWVLPALAALAVATLWLVGPVQRESGPIDERAAILPQQGGPAGGPSLLNDVTPADRQSNTVDRARDSMPLASPSRTLVDTQRGLIGEWTGFYQGQRRLIVRESGLATMVVEPDGLAAMLLAPKLTFEVRWTINGEQLEFETLGGEPLDKVQVVVKMYGKRRSHRILQLNQNKIVLLDEDGVTEYVWNRVQIEPMVQTSSATE